MTITFDQPVAVGDMQHRISVSSMEVITIAFNLAPGTGEGRINVSITLRDPATGFQQHFVYDDDKHTPEFWQQVEPLQVAGQKWMAILLDRLIADGKLPEGTLS